MKTPKRHYELTTMEHSSCKRIWDRNQEEVSAQRWKRKNRVKQLKKSLRKYKEGTMLPKLMHIRLAYKWLQELKKPKQNEGVKCWHTYLSELKSIQYSINFAVEDAAICLGEAIEREERKEKQ